MHPIKDVEQNIATSIPLTRFDQNNYIGLKWFMIFTTQDSNNEMRILKLNVSSEIEATKAHCTPYTLEGNSN